MISSRFLFALLAFFCMNTSAFSASKDSLIIECSRKNINEFISHKEQHKDVRSIVLKGSYTGIRWNKLLKAMSELTQLGQVIFVSSNFDQLPSSIAELKHIKDLTIVGSDRFDLEEGLPLLAEMSSLKKLTVELEYPDEIPYGIRDIGSLEEVVILDTELSDIRIDHEKALTDLSLSRSTTMIEREENETAIRIMFISPEEMEDFTIEEEEEVVDGIEEQEEMMDELSFKDENPVFAVAKEIEKPADAFERDYKSFAPPVEEMDIKKEYYQVETNVPTVIFSKCSGSQVLIPEDAFVDAEGNEVKGDVVIDYRELRDPLDFIFSGIPMTFQEGGEISFFRSAGMFEINASQHGKEVFLKEDKEMEINFSSTDNTEQYNFYAYADSSGQWKEDGIASFASANDIVTTPVFSSAFYYYRQNANRRFYKFTADSTSYNERFEDLSYKNANLKPRYTYGKQGIVKKQPSLCKDCQIKIIKARRSKGKVIFEVENTTGMNNEFSRLDVKHWRLEESMTSKEFRAAYARKKEYSDIRVVEEDGAYLLRLKSKKGIAEIHAVPVKAIKKKMRITYQEKEASYKAYQKALSAKQKRFDKSVKRDIKDISRCVKRINKGKATNEEVWKLTWKYMTDEERQLSFDEWNTYCDSIIEIEEKQISASLTFQQNFTRSLSIDGFGIFNCDQIERLSNPVNVLADYRDENGAMNNVRSTYVIDKNINAVLLFSPSNIAFDPGSDYCILTIDMDGTVAAARKEDLDTEDIRSWKSFTFAMNDYGTTSVSDLRKTLGLE